MLIFPEIDEKQTLSNVKSFFKNDFKKVERLSGYDGVISSPSFDGLPHSTNNQSPDNFFIKHASYAELFKAVVNAINKCTEHHRIILKGYYLDGLKGFQIQQRLVISKSAYYERKNKAELEFADRLLVTTAKLGDENIIDLHAYKK